MIEPLPNKPRVQTPVPPKTNTKGRHWYLTPVIQATWDLEIWRIMVPGQPGQKSLQDPTSKEKSWVWWCAPIILAESGSLK
jgi:hypothetical protein